MTDLQELKPLADVVAETIRDTPIRLGSDDWASTLGAALTARVAAYVGRVLPRTDGMAQFVTAVDAERQRQLAKFGEQHHPDGTGGPVMRQQADAARAACQYLADNGGPDWRAILLEEVYEALAESDPAALETELIQVAAVIAAWIADLHTRRPAAPEGGAR